MRWKMKTIKLYLGHWISYPPFFFTHAPLRQWLTFFSSTHRVAKQCAYAVSAIRDADVWDKIPVRNEIMAKMEAARAVSAHTSDKDRNEDDGAFF